MARETKYSRVKAACEQAADDLMGVGERSKDLPKTFKERIKQLVAEIRGHDLDQYREELKQLSGDYTTVADMLMIIKDATGSTKWKGHEVKEDDCAAPDADSLRDYYGIDVKQQDIKYFQFIRDCRSRDDLWLVTIVAMPGHVYCSMDTGRVNWEMTPSLVENHAFAKAFKKEMKDQGLD